MEGFIPLTNRQLEALAAARMPGRHFQVALAMIRKLPGWRRAEDSISASQIAELTGLDRRNVHRIMIDLERRGMFSRAPGSARRPARWSFVEDPERWLVGSLVTLPAVVASDPTGFCVGSPATTAVVASDPTGASSTTHTTDKRHLSTDNSPAAPRPADPSAPAPEPEEPIRAPEPEPPRAPEPEPAARPEERPAASRARPRRAAPAALFPEAPAPEPGPPKQVPIGQAAVAAWYAAYRQHRTTEPTPLAGRDTKQLKDAAQRLSLERFEAALGAFFRSPEIREHFYVKSNGFTVRSLLYVLERCDAIAQREARDEAKRRARELEEARMRADLEDPEVDAIWRSNLVQVAS